MHIAQMFVTLGVFLLTCRFCNQGMWSKRLAACSYTRLCIIWLRECQRRGEENNSVIYSACDCIYTHGCSKLCGQLGCFRLYWLIALCTPHLSGLASQVVHLRLLQVYICTKKRDALRYCFWTQEANCWNTCIQVLYWLPIGEKSIKITCIQPWPACCYSHGNSKGINSP